MTNDTIVAVYDTPAQAQAAVRDLIAAGISASAISQHSNGSLTSTDTSSGREPGFWSSLFGLDAEHDTTVYDRSVESGSTVVSVRAAGDEYESVSAILEHHHPVDIDERAAGYGLSETRRTTPDVAARGTATEGGTIQLAEETIAIGKRAVSGGTTRVRRYVVETPVEEQVTLRTEKVTLERRPVADGRVVGTADFTDKVIEMTETSEEAVIAKTTRVVEEVNLRKEATERVETVRDTVRRDEVEIEQVPGRQAAAG